MQEGQQAGGTLLNSRQPRLMDRNGEDCRHALEGGHQNSSQWPSEDLA